MDLNSSVVFKAFFLSSTWYHINFIFGEPQPIEAINNIVSISILLLLNAPQLDCFLHLVHSYVFVYLLCLWNIVNFFEI